MIPGITTGWCAIQTVRLVIIIITIIIIKIIFRVSVFICLLALYNPSIKQMRKIYAIDDQPKKETQTYNKIVMTSNHLNH